MHPDLGINKISSLGFIFGKNERIRIFAVKSLSKITLAFKAVRELGLHQLGLYGLYRLGVVTGFYKLLPRASKSISETQVDQSRFQMDRALDLPDPSDIIDIIGNAGLSDLIREADRIVNGKVRLFGRESVSLELNPGDKLNHWTYYEFGNHKPAASHFLRYPADDIKFIWEPARFGWAFTLARAYHLTKDEGYPEAFWKYFERFHKANPIGKGPNWVSAQEVALRILSFAFCGEVFVESPHSSEIRKTQLGVSVASHASRIMVTLIYARAQNNNHLLSEAAGLISASLVLPNHPDAKKWGVTGWKWFNRGLETQIGTDGTYIQHSTNYHRLMLQLALWVCAVHKKTATEELGNLTTRLKTGKEYFSGCAASNLKRAVDWLIIHTDSGSGRAPNLGSNDGAYILPLTVQPLYDYRPIIQASARTFLGVEVFDPGPWDEMSLWFNAQLKMSGEADVFDLVPDKSFRIPDVIHHPNCKSWIYLRTAKFDDRPGHADQLHVDLWWRGLNIAQDAGTYLYNGSPPWDNGLTHTAVHNTVMIDGIEQMTRAGRFLYLDRAQGEIVPSRQGEDESLVRLCASHNGYRRLGIRHTRSISVNQNHNWVVEDYIQPVDKSIANKSHSLRLHWLLPDWEFELLDQACDLRLRSPHGWISLSVSLPGVGPAVVRNLEFCIVRGGELVIGTGPISPTWGWVSPTYGVKNPAISYSVSCRGTLPLNLMSVWRFLEG
jgi:hypothetical protein